MSDRASFQNSYLKRYLLLAGVCLPLSLWFAYDGFIGYPKQLEIAEAYDKLRDLESTERQSQWQAIASTNGWPSRIPEKTAAEIADSIFGQYVWGSLSFAAGLIALLYYLRSRGTWVEPTETGLTTSWGQKLDFKDVIRLDKKKWESKGIAKATYRDSNLNRVFVFDDFKFDREPLGKILRGLENTLDRALIVGGPTEAERDQEILESQAAESSNKEIETS
jgi:hypothetical protein